MYFVYVCKYGLNILFMIINIAENNVNMLCSKLYFYIVNPLINT